MQHIHYHNDFTVPISLVANSITINPDIIGSITFYTRKQGNIYCCCWDCKTLYKEGDYVYAVLNEHNLETGVLKYMVEYQIPDNNYPDKHQKICQHYTSDIELTKENGDITVADAQIIYGETIEELIESAGYSYTKDEIDDMIASLGGDGIVVNKTNWAADVLSNDNTRYIIADALNFNELTDLPVGDNCEITFLTTGSFGNNVNLQINNAYIDAPLKQIFNGTKITGFFHNSQIPVEWFGAKGDGETDDAEAINTTIKYAGKSEVLLSAPIYVIGSTIHICEDNANFDTYEGQIEAAKSEEGGKKFLCKGSIYSTSNFTGYTTKNVTIPVMIRLAASNATVRIEGAIVVHSDLTDCIGFFHQGYHDNKVYIARIMKGRDYIGYWNWLDGTVNYTNQAAMNLGTCDGVVYVYAMGGDFECEQICGFNNAFMVSDKYAIAYAAVQQASFKFASLSANYGIRVRVGNNDGLLKKNTRGWFNACRVEYNGISGEQEGQRFLPSTDSTFIKVDSSNNVVTFCQNRFICNSVEPMWYKLMDINIARGDYFEFLGNYGDCHTITYDNGIPNASTLGTSAPTVCYNGGEPYTSTNKFINIRNAKDILINTVTEYYAMPYDTIFVEDSQNVVFTNCQSAKYLKNTYYQYDRNHRRFDKVIFTTSNELDNNSEDVIVFEVDKRELDQIKYVDIINSIDTTVDGLYVITTPAFSSKFKLYPLYEVLSGVLTQLGYCYDNVGMITSHNELVTALANVTVDAYTKAQTDTLLSWKADKNGNANETFSANSLNLQRDGAATTLYNYSSNGDDYVSFYDRTGGSLNYKFTANKGDNIATERQLALKANSADVYNKSEVYTKSETYNKEEVNNLIPELPDNIVTDASYVHTDNNFTTTEKNKLSGIASGAEVNVQANWNETNTSSDAYIQNKPSIPTVDSSITGVSQTNPVQGGAIYTALQGKAGYKWYNSKSYMDADTSVPTGTIGFDSDEEKFYIYNSANVEWKPIDETGGGESKIVLYAIMNKDDDTCTIQNTEYKTLTCSAVKALLNDPTKDVVLRTYDPNDNPNYIEYRLYSYYDDTDLESYYFFYSDESNIYIIDLDATRSYTDTWDCYTSTYTIPTSPGKLGFGFGTQNNTSTSSVSATVNNYQKVAGGIVAIKFTKTLANAPQLNINGTGSSRIYFRGALCPANTIQSGDIVTLMYTSSGTYEILSITTNRSNDASDVGYTASGGIIRVDTTRYKTYKIKDYSTTVPSGTTGIQFRFSKNTNYNTEPVTTLILRAENYSKIDWSALSVSFYSQISGTSTEVTIKWKDNDSPINTLAHLGNGVDYVVIKVYEGEYGTYEAW